MAMAAFDEYDRVHDLQKRSIVFGYAFKPAKPLSLLHRFAASIPLSPPKFTQTNELITTSDHRSIQEVTDPQPSTQQIDSRLRILVAEDNKINQKVALNQLKNLGYEADIACDGEEVLAKIACQDYDAILMDCHMPRLDGYATTREVRLRERNVRHTIIIALTASAMKEDLELAMAAGMDDFLSKPVRKEELAARITQCIQTRSAQSNGLPSAPAIDGKITRSWLCKLSADRKSIQPIVGND